MGSRFVRPSTRTLTLANGDTLTVKRRLSSGEQRAAFARMYLTGADGALSLNTLQTGMAIITAYLVNWSLTDDDGQHVDIAGLSTDALEAVIDNLDPESFTEIKIAIEAHEAEMLAERDAQKKILGGAPGSAPISLSPPAPDSPSTKSETLM